MSVYTSVSVTSLFWKVVLNAYTSAAGFLVMFAPGVSTPTARQSSLYIHNLKSHQVVSPEGVVPGR